MAEVVERDEKEHELPVHDSHYDEETHEADDFRQAPARFRSTAGLQLAQARPRIVAHVAEEGVGPDAFRLVVVAVAVDGRPVDGVAVLADLVAVAAMVPRMDGVVADLREAERERLHEAEEPVEQVGHCTAVSGGNQTLRVKETLLLQMHCVCINIARMRFFSFLVVLLATVVPNRAAIPIVAAENFYGGVAKQIGGDQVSVTSILTNPDQDPHLFTVDPKTAREMSTAAIVIGSGIDYDPWMAQLDSAHPNPARVSINVAGLVAAQEGANPHIWYRPDTIPYFQANLTAFLATLQPVHARIAALKARFGGTDVLATEPVFGYMAEALGFKMHDMGFQNHVMNNVEPTARETAEFESLLRGHKVKLLFYNGQASDPVASRMQDIAKASGIPVVGVTETEPAGTTYASWMLTQLDAVEKALSK
jgi:zinc/manganese transport system substrate-binding protein